jgi:phosphoribosylglycinamide formyltransferase-1
MAGFLKLAPVPDDFAGRVVNIHPSLLPDFGGQGMYGIHVHRAVLDAGRRESGCTVHFCTNEYDRGPIIIQKPAAVLPGDTPETLAERVFAAEQVAYPEAIRILAKSREFARCPSETSCR